MVELKHILQQMKTYTKPVFHFFHHNSIYWVILLVSDKYESEEEGGEKGKKGKKKKKKGKKGGERREKRGKKKRRKEEEKKEKGGRERRETGSVQPEDELSPQKSLLGCVSVSQCRLYEKWVILKQLVGLLSVEIMQK
jgi:hypothetical protein